MLLFFTMLGDRPTDAEVIQALRAAGRKGFQAHPRAQRSLMQLDYDLESVCELIAECDERELIKHEPDDNEERRDRYYVAVLHLDLEGELLPFYVKIRFDRPNLDGAYLLSFHL